MSEVGCAQENMTFPHRWGHSKEKVKPGSMMAHQEASDFAKFRAKSIAYTV